jgi:anti-anti-sigma regulatory factor
MEFKIDTKNTFSVVTPLIDKVSANLSGDILNECRNIRQSGSFNIILGLQQVNEIEKAAINDLILFHEESYSDGHSFVLTGLSPKVAAAIKENDEDTLLNIAPSMQEAIDIISMEILERDLFNEE